MPITFQGEGQDPESGARTGDALTWNSSRDGDLGTGTSFERSDLTPGVHTVRLTVADPDGATATDEVTIAVEEDAGDIGNDGDTDDDSGDTGDTDPGTGETGTIALRLGAEESSDGEVGGELTLPVVVDLSASGELDVAELELEIQWEPARLGWGSTEDGSFGTVVVDTEQAAGGSVTASVSSSTGTGESFTALTLILDILDTTGEAHVTASVTAIHDEAGESLLSNIEIRDHTVVVTDAGNDTPNSSPTVSILTPMDEDVFRTSETVSFTSTADDPEDGTLTGTALVWESDLDGPIGTGASFGTDDLTAGEHVITLTATDSRGASTSASVDFQFGIPDLTEGQWTSALSDETGGKKYFQFLHPGGGIGDFQLKARFRLGGVGFGGGGLGNPTLYVRFNALPTIHDYDCRSDAPSYTERCDLPVGGMAPWYVMIVADGGRYADIGAKAVVVTNDDPDLVVEAFTMAPANIITDEYTRATFTIRNVGGGATTDMFGNTEGVEWFLEVDSASAYGGPVIGNHTAGGTTPPLGPGEAVTIETGDLGSFGPGQHRVDLGVDMSQVDSGDFEEWDEDNNRAVQTFNAFGRGFKVDFRLDLPPGSPVDEGLLHRAAERWESVMPSELVNWTLTLQEGECGNAGRIAEDVDDLLVFVSQEPIDGPGGLLATAGWCVVREPPYGSGPISFGDPAFPSPVAGGIIFDSEDLPALTSAQIEQLAAHELGHVMGVGTLWSSFDLLQGAGTSSPVFVGDGAVAEYQALGGFTGAGGGVPVENTGGEATRDRHWRESSLGAELMTGYLNGGGNPLSTVTVGSLEDLGYAVDLGFADSFSLTAPTGDLLEGGIVVRDGPWEGPQFIGRSDGTKVMIRNDDGR